MKKIFLAAAGLILLGSGCTANVTTPTADNTNGNDVALAPSPTSTIEVPQDPNNPPIPGPHVGNPPTTTPAPVTQPQPQTQPQPKPTTSTQTPANDSKSFTMDQVRTANSAEKCWTVVNGKVYDVTGFINQHPGGRQAILSLCGKDGTVVFTAQHGGQRNPERELQSLYIGDLK